MISLLSLNPLLNSNFNATSQRCCRCIYVMPWYWVFRFVIILPHSCQRNLCLYLFFTICVSHVRINWEACTWGTGECEHSGCSWCMPCHFPEMLDLLSTKTASVSLFPKLSPNVLPFYFLITSIGTSDWIIHPLLAHQYRNFYQHDAWMRKPQKN